MSIKAKLSLLISFIVTIILTLNISIYYFTSINDLQESAEKQMVTIAKQIGTSLNAAEQSKKFMEDTLGEKLRAAAIAAQNELDPRIDYVQNSELITLSLKLGVDDITLWKRSANDIVALKSSDPNELNQGSNSWDYWYTAFNQLFELQEVTVLQGQTLLNYWSGPFQYASSDPSSIKKWGYYYDGTTDYMINPYIDAKEFLDFEDQIGTDALITNLMNNNPNILEITGFNPAFFGEPDHLTLKKGQLVHNLDVRAIEFGKYTYKDKGTDISYVNEAAQSGDLYTTTGVLNGQSVIRSFIPLDEGSKLVIGVSFDQAEIKHILNRQLLIHCSISVSLILIAWMVSYFIAGVLIRPLRQILHNINEISEGRFGEHLSIKRHDELGFLSARVNIMADNLQEYMGKIRETEEVIRRSEKLSIVGQLAAGVAHEIRNPLTTLKGFVQLHQKKGALSDAHLKIMLSELDRINFIVSEFLVLAKPSITQYQLINIQDIIQDMIMLINIEASVNKITFEIQASDEGEIPAVVCEPNQMKQVFVNLLKNSAEAMPNGGTISIDLKHSEAEGAVIIRVVDTGIGIDEVDLPRLGEPFFTRKDSGNGLGLMVSQRIIANHKGTMDIISKLGEGTCVIIKLPTQTV